MSINSISVNSQKVNFNGIKRSQRGINYHHTNAGLAVGSTIGLLGAGFWASQRKGLTANDIKYFRESGLKEKEILNLIKLSDRMKKVAIPCGIIAAAASIGCGLIIDMLRNKKAQRIAEQAAIQGPQQTCMTNPDARMTPYGTAYHHSKEGKRTGALLGVICGSAHAFMIGTPVNLPVVLAFTLGGLLAGAITDKISNNKAQNTITYY